MGKQAVIFDLDGVIVSTDEFHYRAWKAIADREGIYFDEEINQGLRGVSRMESLEVLLRNSPRSYDPVEKEELALRKNEIYRGLLAELTPAAILPGVHELLDRLRSLGIRLAIGSSSKNTPLILKKIGLENFFDAVADGSEIQNSKPDPEVFLLAARKLGAAPADCLVVEDAEAGLRAAKAAGMYALGVGIPAHLPSADRVIPSLHEFPLDLVGA
jgi:beta-phosphoglucomutase